MAAGGSVARLKLPSPVRRLPLEAPSGTELWMKDDGAIGDLYGGNKVRKLQLILPHAQARSAKRLVTFGAVGSHHVLATTLLGRRAGFSVKALLFPQPRTLHALKNLRQALAAGLEAEPVSSLALMPLAIARTLRPGDYLVPAGGSGPIGSQGYYRAAGELAGQIDAGLLPIPDIIVVPLGSGGTAAGLLAGLAASGLRSLVCGVDVSIGNRASKLLVTGLARWLAARSNLEHVGDTMARQLVVDTRYLGRGYGWETPATRQAMQIAATCGVTLDVTYTAKAFAKALELGGFPGYEPSYWPRRQAREPDPRLEQVLRASDRPLRVLYWHTLSRVNPTGLQDSEIPSRLMKQFLRS